MLIKRKSSLLLVLGLFFWITTAQAEPVPLDNIVAIVNDDVVTQTELNYRTRVIKQQMKDAKVTLPEDSVLEPQVLDRIIEQMLVIQAAERFGVFVDDQALNQALYTVARQNKVSVSELRGMLEDEGIDYEKFLDDLRTQLIVQRTEQRMVSNEITLSDEEVEHLYQQSLKSSQQNKQYRVGHILIALTQDPTPEHLAEAQQRALEAQTMLLDTNDFHQVALRYSDSKDVLNQSDLGFRRFNEMPSLFANAVTDMKVGDTAGPFRNSSGLHIIQLLEVQQDAPEEKQLVTETHVRHILLKTNPARNDAETEKAASEIYKSLADGADFATLAKAHSEDLGTKQSGGDLNWMKSKQFVPAFATAMDSLDVNEISKPVKTEFGWHIIQVLERRQSDVTRDTLKAQIQDQIYRRKFNEALQNWYTQLRDQALIEVYI